MTRSTFATSEESVQITCAVNYSGNFDSIFNGLEQHNVVAMRQRSKVGPQVTSRLTNVGIFSEQIKLAEKSFNESFGCRLTISGNVAMDTCQICPSERRKTKPTHRLHPF
jgi:hypothetical protein